jgi:hypothetical protein
VHPRNKVVVAIANKLARMAWAVLFSGKDYQHQRLQDFQSALGGIPQDEPGRRPLGIRYGRISIKLGCFLRIGGTSHTEIRGNELQVAGFVHC